MTKIIVILFQLILICLQGCSPKSPQPPVAEAEKILPEQTKPVAKHPAAYPSYEMYSKQNFCLDETILAEAEAQHGPEARQRLAEWEALIRTDTSTNDAQKLQKVNDYFNKMNVIDDDVQWGQEDYWATPVEFLTRNGGDCEDFSIAKYFTLKAMGVNVRRIHLTYAKNLNIDDYHMVMTYSEIPGIKPLVLDNLTNDILEASQRTDLLPVYSLNDTGLWRAQKSRMGPQVGNSKEISRWKELLSRMPKCQQ